MFKSWRTSGVCGELITYAPVSIFTSGGEEVVMQRERACMGVNGRERDAAPKEEIPKVLACIKCASPDRIPQKSWQHSE